MSVPNRPGQVVTHRTNGGVGITTDPGVSKRTGSIGVMWTGTPYAVKERPEALEVIDPAAVQALISR